MKKDVQIGVRVTSELRDALRKLAEADQRPLSSYITLVLQRHVAGDGPAAKAAPPSRRR